jgi:hypothetical protein
MMIDGSLQLAHALLKVLNSTDAGVQKSVICSSLHV